MPSGGDTIIHIEHKYFPMYIQNHIQNSIFFRQYELCNKLKYPKLYEKILYTCGTTNDNDQYPSNHIGFQKIKNIY